MRGKKRFDARYGVSRKTGALRKKKGLTQQALANAGGIHVTQLSRYESGSSQPTLDVIRKIAVALSVSADELIFDENEREAARRSAPAV